MSAAQHAAEERRDDHAAIKAVRQSRLSLYLVILGAALFVAAAVVYSNRSDSLEGEKRQTEQQLNVAEARLDAALDRVLALCQASGAEAEKLRSVGLCDQAAKEKDAPATPEVSFSVVRDAVQAYLAANPPRDGKTPTAEELLPIVQQVYAANPPKDGRTPTDEELLTLIRQVYAANPPQDGKDGKDGRDGQSPPCLSEPDQCRGADGADGADGKPPAAWTWTDSAGREQSCSRSGGSDDAPTYTCTAEPPAQPTPTTTTTAPLLPPS